jgi:Mlc titration factor MtfA (ptsG expression regulator)
LAAGFLHTKRFHALGDAALDDFWRLVIAMQASLPALPHGPKVFKGWTNVLIYPGEFNVRRNHYDAPTGVVTDRDDTLIGEAWERGPMVLSLADVALDIDARGMASTSSCMKWRTSSTCWPVRQTACRRYLHR